MRITFNGAAQSVTGSQYLVEVNGYSVLLDCGLYQGPRQESFDRNRSFRFDTTKLQAVILSHAHIDHSGNLPNLCNSGFNGPIYTTNATTKLGAVMLEDSGHIQEEDSVYVNKKRAKQGLPAVEPLYTVEDALKAIQQYRPVRYNDPFQPIPGLTVTLVDAGHILGSASIVLDVNENGHKFRFWFSGDIGRLNLPIIPDPVLPSNVDYLMMECTYGNREHPDHEEAYTTFRDAINRTVDRGGKVIIPAFAVGRTQELVYDINRMLSNNEIPRIPVFVDSPLAVRATSVFKASPEFLDRDTLRFIKDGLHPALSFNGLRYISDVADSKKLNDMPEPMIIISASGMAEVGRILHHLKNNIEDERNTVCIVGWQAPNTLGRRLAEEERNIKIFGVSYYRRAEVVKINGYSAHAGQSFLMEYAMATQETLKQVILVHGEEDAANTLKQKMYQAGINNVVYPAMYDVMEF